MRAVFLEAYQDLSSINTKRDILSIQVNSEQQYFLQALGNLSLLNTHQEVGEIMKILQFYRGSYSTLILYLKYVSYSMEKQLTQKYIHFPVLKLLSKWVQTYQTLKKKKDIRLYPAVIQNLHKGLVSYEQFIVYLNYISLDLFALIKSGSQQSRKQSTQQKTKINNKYLECNDLISILKVILPKTLFNIAVPRIFFPQTLLKQQKELIDVLYSYQNLQNIIHSKPHYTVLIKNIFKILLAMDLQANQLKQVILSSFNYYYLFHYDKQHNASQIIIESFKKITIAVRYAINQQIYVYLCILKKIGKELFINYLADKFQWVGQTLKQTQYSSGGNKGAIKPFFNKVMNNSEQIKVQPGKIVKRYVEVYDRFSLLYFSLNCIEHDVTLKFYYMGDFNKPQGVQDKKLLFGSQKKQGIFQGSIQAIQRGIYMFQLDNSYSWVKSKIVTYDIALIVPLQIRQHAKNIIKPIIYEKYDLLNEVPYQNVIGWIDQNQIKLQSSSANVTIVYETDDSSSNHANQSNHHHSRHKVYNFKLTSNIGSIYEYQSQSKSRFIHKVQHYARNPNIFWLIDGYRIEGIKQILMWVQGQYQPEKNIAMTQQASLQQQKQQINIVDGSKIQSYNAMQKKQSYNDAIQKKQQQLRNEGNQQLGKIGQDVGRQQQTIEQKHELGEAVQQTKQCKQLQEQFKQQLQQQFKKQAQKQVEKQINLNGGTEQQAEKQKQRIDYLQQASDQIINANNCNIASKQYINEDQ